MKNLMLQIIRAIIVEMCLVILCPIDSDAQKITKSNLKTGISYTKFDSKNSGTSDLTGICVYNEFSHRINKNFTLAPSFQLGYASRQAEFPYYLVNKVYGGLDFNMFVYPIKLGISEIRFGAGPSTRIFKGNDLTEFIVTAKREDSSTDWSLVNLYVRNRTQIPVSVDIGYSAIVETQFNFPHSWNVSVRATYQRYLKNNSILSTGLNIGKSF